MAHIRDEDFGINSPLHNQNVFFFLKICRIEQYVVEYFFFIIEQNSAFRIRVVVDC